MHSNDKCAGHADQTITVSVVCPVFNAEDYLRECIDSIIAQTYEDIELILVDDGSSDGSLKICEEYRSSYPNRRIIVLSKDNEGVVRTREMGLSHASGEISILIDADDYYMRNDAIEMIADAYMRNHFDVCFINAYHERFKQKAVAYPWESGLLDLEEVRGTAVSFCSKSGEPCDMGYAVIKAFKTELFPTCEYENPPTLFEDTLITFELLDRASVVYLIDEEFYFYRNNGVSALMRTGFFERIRCCDILFSNRDRYSKKWNLDKEWSEQLAKSNQALVVAYLEQAIMLPPDERIKGFEALYETSLCKSWRLERGAHSRIDKDIVLHLFRQKRFALLARVLVARKSSLSLLKSILKK